jgi:hypothetical protein
MNAQVMLETLRARFSGDSLRGLHGDAARAKVGTFTRDRLLALWRVELPKAPAFHLAMDAARAREVDAIRGILQDRIDRGDAGLLAFNTHGPAMAEVAAAFVAANKDEYGLRTPDPSEGQVSAANVLQAIHQRLGILGEALRNDYQLHGEPAAAEALRKDISKATMATWARTKALKDAQEAHRHCGLPETEAATLAAQAELRAAELEVQALRKRLSDEFAITH